MNGPQRGRVGDCGRRIVFRADDLDRAIFKGRDALERRLSELTGMESKMCGNPAQVVSINRPYF